MASAKSTTTASTSKQVKALAKFTPAKASFADPRPASPKGPGQVKPKAPANTAKARTVNPERIKALLQIYGEALDRSRSAGRPVSVRIDVDPEGQTTITPIEEAAAPLVKDAIAPNVELEAALTAARQRGRSAAAEILSGEDMLSADSFAKLLGTTRVTVNTKRQHGQVLGLDGAKRGFRFPTWQLDPDGKPYAGLAALHERLGGPWAVYRFLVQPHGELDGLTGRQALERGKANAALQAAETLGRDFR